MATNLVEVIQLNLQYPELKKIDPNLQDISRKETQSTVELLGQSGIPAVLTGLYKLSRTEEGCLKILNSGSDDDSISVLFNGNENQLSENVAKYAGVELNQAESHLENIADEALRLARELVGDKAEPLKLEQYMNGQRHSILVYLPAALNLGYLLKDEGLDDKTNKMEGPVSSFMHSIENKFSGGGS